ncbi:amino acid permease [Actinomyces sp. B33]|uniref:amino acid permease n=1 Tax=Actinomyces sp. B33 TaxID=2942131 RepID=UPI0023412515|nr:amino acid permease [Actinomyces sp. B33]MDC4233902.1 amino acid permease [Actinomyces sp. B33]
MSASPAAPSTAGDQHLQRTLTNRHVQLIAIGGAIGTGLFMGSGKTISIAGPSILLVYIIIGAVLFLFMRTMGELLLSTRHYTTFADIARDLIGPWAGFVTGWTYWMCWIVTGVADMVAITGYVRFWWPDTPAWIPIVAMTILLFALNVMTVKAFGETEFWFALVKIIAILALVVVGLTMVAAGTVDQAGTAAAVSNLWAHGGFFPTGFHGFLGGFQIALFAFVGIELIGTTVAETADPDTTLPKAVNSIPVRIMLFYVAALAAIMMVTPWDQINPEASPFVTMFSMTGLAAAATVVNLVVLTSAASSANSGIYSTSRMLYGLAARGDAPRVFRRLSGRHVPRNALFLSCLCLLSGIAVMASGDSIADAFTLVTSMSATLFMGVWVVIVVSYLLYLRRRPDLHAASRFPAPGGAASAWTVLVFMALMLVVLSLRADTRAGMIASLAWIAFIVVAALVNRHRMLRRAETGSAVDYGG